MASSRIIFLDRDGTLNVDCGYVTEPAQLELIPGVAKALASLCKLGFRLVVVTNQSAIARGLTTGAQVEIINEALLNALLVEDSSIFIEKFFYCPHHSSDNCSCRKPKTGMVDVFLSGQEIDFKNCWMIGDKQMDLDFGINLGIPVSQNLLVMTGHGEAEFSKCKNNESRKHLINWYFSSIVEASDYIVSKVSKESDS